MLKMASLFEDFSLHLEHEQEIRETIRQRVRDVEQTGRQLNLVLSKIHQSVTSEDILAVVTEAEEVFKSKVKSSFQKLAEAVPTSQYYRFHQNFNYSIQRSVYLAALTFYLKEDRLMTKNEAAKWLTQLSNELSRFAVNSVTHGDYGRPQRIASFLNDLLTGFRLLNLKNDGLRKKFDSLKYDMKKVEEVVYDLSIRNLIKSNPAILVEDKSKVSDE